MGVATLEESDKEKARMAKLQCKEQARKNNASSKILRGNLIRDLPRNVLY